MALRRFQGPLVREGVQTGDGRFMAPGALDHQSLPMPLAWLKESMHGGVSFGGPQVGTIETVERQENGALWGTGHIDDAHPDGAELVRRLEEGTASMGHQQGVSIDGDDFAVDILVDWGDDDGMMLFDAEKVALSTTGTDAGPLVLGASKVRAALASHLGLTAAAGDTEDPKDKDSYDLIFEARADEFLERYTRMRLRGATAVDVPAFADCWIELDDAEPVAASAAPATVNGGLRGYTPPPPEFFLNPELEGPTPMTITEHRQVFGHIACWNACHTGYSDRCVVPPRASNRYDSFLTGEVVDADGYRHAVGALVWGIDHADTKRPLSRQEVMAHYYADSTKGWADVTVGEDAHGIWMNGHLRPHVTDEEVRTLQALKPSGDWRARPGTRQLDLLGVLAVNVAGFPVPRGALVAAAGAVPTPLAPTVAFGDDGAVVALVAAGAPVHAAPPLGSAGVTAALGRLSAQVAEVAAVAKVLDLRTRHLRGAQAEHLRQRLDQLSD